ncbi:MAG: MFS transporter, partial [Anaerolineaceae bacterium]|nr:MFS transporter [Anaerolineaceae bacterium]
FQDFVAGQRFIRRTPIIVTLLLMVAIPSFWGFPFLQLIPVFARDLLRQAGDTSIIVATRNSILVTSQGVGALLASLILASFSLYRRKGTLLMMGQVAFAVALFGMGLSRGLGSAIPLMALLGWGVVMQLALTNTLIQLAAPDELRGRVISSFLWVLQGIAPFGSLFLGWFVQSWGAANAAIVCGGVCLIGYLLVRILRPSIYRINS